MKDETQSFEKAYERLEVILEKMHADTVSLDQALALYEEADRLVTTCQKWLNDAEKKIEILLKNRDGSPQLGADGKPQTEPFTPPEQAALR